MNQQLVFVCKTQLEMNLHWSHVFCFITLWINFYTK